MGSTKIVDYKVLFVKSFHLKGPDASDLEEAVKEEMKSGWVPFGGVAINNAFLLQALVKYE